MPRRENLPPSWFETNPLEGLSPEEQYEQVRWGNEPHRHTEVEVPALRETQYLIELGKLRVVFVELEHAQVGAVVLERPYPSLAFGEVDNRIYLVGGSLGKMARRRLFGPVGSSRAILQVDYQANKGGEFVYWWHAHERPYPRLKILANGLPCYVGGKYRVAREGIVG